MLLWHQILYCYHMVFQLHPLASLPSYFTIFLLFLLLCQQADNAELFFVTQLGWGDVWVRLLSVWETGSKIAVRQYEMTPQS